jgi:hypothetical protein
MAAIDKLLARFGFVRLADYGLTLGPDGRVMSWRDAVLDDGGRKIVGWLASDPAPGLLSPWAPRSPASPTPVAAVATPVASAPVAVSALAAEVDAELEMDDDEWEWAIVMARARAVAADDRAAAPIVMLAETAASVVHTAAPTVAAMPAAARVIQIPTRAPVDHARDHARPLLARPPLPVVRRPRAETVPPPVRTVIPVPPLPKFTTAAVAEPRVRALPTPIPPASPRRFPKGTAPIDHGAIRRHVAVVTPGPIAESVDALPAAAATIALPPLPSIVARTAR